MNNLREAAQQALELIDEFKRQWMRIPAFADRLNKTTREAISAAHGPVFEIEHVLRAALGKPDDKAQRAVVAGWMIYYDGADGHGPSGFMEDMKFFQDRQTCDEYIDMGPCYSARKVFITTTLLAEQQDKTQSDDKPVEAWHGDRKVSVYEDVVLRSWGPNIDSMESVPRSAQAVQDAFVWLYAAQQPDDKAQPVAWISHNVLTGKDTYAKLPIQSLQPGVYRHTPLYA